MNLTVLTPPIAFLILLAAAGLLSTGLRRLSIRSGRLTEPYSCGEEWPAT